MTEIELKKLLINKIIEIDDVPFLEAIKVIIEKNTLAKTITLSNNILDELEEAQSQYHNGQTTTQDELGKEFKEWLN